MHSKILFLIIFLLVATSASAQRFKQKIFKLSTQNSQDSSVLLDAQFPAPTKVRWVWIVTQKNGKKSNQFFESKDQLFNEKVWLRKGPGVYKVEVLTSAADSQYNSEYYLLDSFEIENSDLRENIDELVPSEDVQSEDALIVELVETITHGLTTELEKTSAIHDWVAQNISYDIESFLDGTYATKDGSALQTLKDKMGVCQGYANLTAALNRAAGIPAKVVTGESIQRGKEWKGVSNHAWNEVLIEGKWLSQDTTWDAGYIDGRSKKFTFMFSRKYFHPDPAEFALDHRLDP